MYIFFVNNSHDKIDMGKIVYLMKDEELLRRILTLFERAVFFAPRDMEDAPKMYSAFRKVRIDLQKLGGTLINDTVARECFKDIQMILYGVEKIGKKYPEIQRGKQNWNAIRDFFDIRNDIDPILKKAQNRLLELQQQINEFPRIGYKKSHGFEEQRGVSNNNFKQNTEQLKMEKTILILSALHKELDALFNYLGSPFEIEKIVEDNRVYYIYQKSPGLNIICASALGMGQLNSAILAKDAIEKWNPQKIILTGICGALSKKISLGDLIVSDHIVDYELGKVEDAERVTRWNVYRSDAILLNELKNYKNNTWSSYIKEPRPDNKSYKKPAVHFGTYLSGNKVIANEKEADSLKSIWHKAYGIEMEAAGIAAVIHQMKNPPSFIMVKSACDYADSNKNDNWQEYSANASAAFIASYIFESDLNTKKILVVKKEPNLENRKIRFVIAEAYNLSELNVLAHDLDIDFEEITGKGKSEKIVELLKYCKRRNKLRNLIDLINKERDYILADIEV